MSYSNPDYWRQYFECLDLSEDPNPLLGLTRERLLERLDGLKFEPTTIVDLGAGSGESTLALAQRFPKAKVSAIALTEQHYKACRRRRGWWRPKFAVQVGHLENPPIAPESVDLLFAHFSLMYVTDLPQTLMHWRSLLKPHGLMLLSILGPSGPTTPTTPLTESSTGTPDNLNHVSLPHRLDVQALAELLVSVSLNEPVLDTDWINVEYPNTESLARDLHHLGWNIPNDHLQQAVVDGGPIPCQWEVVYASVWAPNVGQTQRLEEGTIAHISVDQIGRRTRP